MKRKTVHQRFYSTVFSPPFCWFTFLVLSSAEDQGAPCSCRWKGGEEGTCWLTPGCKPRHTGCWAEKGRHKPGKRRADTLREGYHWKGSPPPCLLLVACSLELGSSGDFTLLIRNQLGTVECNTQCHLPSRAAAPCCAQPSPSLAALALAGLMSYTSQHQSRGKKRPAIAN